MLSVDQNSRSGFTVVLGDGLVHRDVNVHVHRGRFLVDDVFASHGRDRLGPASTGRKHHADWNLFVTVYDSVQSVFACCQGLPQVWSQNRRALHVYLIFFIIYGGAHDIITMCVHLVDGFRGGYALVQGSDRHILCVCVHVVRHLRPSDILVPQNVKNDIVRCVIARVYPSNGLLGHDRDH